MKEWFKARNIWGAAIMALSDTEAGQLMKALWTYTMTGEQQELSGAEKAVFALILMTLSQDEEHDNDVSGKRAAAGSAGGKQKVAKQANAKIATEEVANEANAYNKNKNKEKEEDIKEIHPSDVQRKAERFSPPTVEQVRAYCQERKNNVDAERFCDFYASKGWKVGSQPMKDWKACVRTWERDDNRGKPALAPVSNKRPAVQDYEQRDYTQRESDLFRRSLQLAAAVGEGG